jgi:hypothetical protein
MLFARYKRIFGCGFQEAMKYPSANWRPEARMAFAPQKTLILRTHILPIFFDIFH